VARDRKRNRRGGRPGRPPGAHVPPRGASDFGVPAGGAEPVGPPEDLGLEDDGAELDGLEEQEEPSSAAAAFGGERRQAGTAPARREAQHGNRVINFLRGCWAELQRVQWPDRRQVAQGTAVVLGFVVIAGLYLGLADQISQDIVNLIL
jgi:preprotein translocase SecE subunit